MITKETAMGIALAYEQVERAEKLLGDVRDATEKFAPKELRDAFGRGVRGLQLGVPSGDNGHRLFDVPYALAVPIIEMHMAEHRAKIALLPAKASEEIAAAKGAA